MDKDTVRQLSLMYALVAEMEGVKANIEGMKTDNIQREVDGASMMWPGDCFVDAQFQLEALAKSLREICEG